MVLLQEIAEPLMKKGYNENGDSKAARSNLRNLVLKQVKKSLGFTDTKIAEDSIVVRHNKRWRVALDWTRS